MPEADLRNGNSSTPQLSSTFYLLHTEINVLYLSISPHNNSTKRLLRYPHFTNEETEAKRDYVSGRGDWAPDLIADPAALRSQLRDLEAQVLSS